MSSKNLQYNTAETSKLEAIVSYPVFNAATIINKIKGLFVRSQIEQARARYQLKRQRQAQATQHQDIVNGLSITEKQRLGMYRFMD